MKKKMIGIAIAAAVAAGVAVAVKKFMEGQDDDFDECTGDCENCPEFCMYGSDGMDGDDSDGCDGGDDGCPCDSTPAEEKSEDGGDGDA